MESHAIRLGSRWTIVFEDAPFSYRCPDLDGGHGVANSMRKAVDWTVRPPTFRTRKAALAAATDGDWELTCCNNGN